MELNIWPVMAERGVHMYTIIEDLESKIRDYYEAAEFAEDNGDYKSALYYLEEANKLRKKLESEKRKQSRQLKSDDYSDFCDAALMLC